MKFNAYDLASYAGKRFAFRDHGHASFFGMGPWVIAEDDLTSWPTSPAGGFRSLVFRPAEGGFSYVPQVFVWPADVNDTFLVDEEETADA